MSGRITAIERAAEGSPLTVYVDGKPILEVSEAVAERLGLEVGMELSAAGRGEGEIALPGGGADGPSSDGAERFASHADELAATREAALRLLAVRARSVRELRERLVRKGLDRRAIAETIEGLSSAGLLDDRAFASMWADERVRLRPVGPLRLRQELFAKGVPKAVIDEVLAATFEEHDEVELAVRAAAKHGGRCDTRKERSRLHAFLVRRGFTFEAAAAAIRRLPAEDDDEEPHI